MLLRGPSGAGKSGLALRVMAAGGRLIADDRVLLWASEGRLFGRAPPALAGLVEVRGVGVMPTPTLAWAEIVMAVDLVTEAGEVDRVPDIQIARLAGVDVVRTTLFPREDSAVPKLEFALQAATLGARREQAYQAPRGMRPKRPARSGGFKRNR